MTKRLILSAILTLAVGCASPARVQVPTSTTSCQEDMPCWDCTSMGNRICGPDAPPHDALARTLP